MFKRPGSGPQRVYDWTDSTDLTNLLRSPLTLGTDFDLDEGVIEGADFCIAYPIDADKLPRWNKNVLLYCHGCRPEGIELMADLDLSDELYSTLLKRGWIIAMSSYRRQGRIIKDAIQDTNNLRDYIVKIYGDPQILLVEGESMGGHIAALISELDPPMYSGVMAVGAALISNHEDCPPFTFSPKIPILYLTNYSEVGMILSYQTKAQAQASNPLPVIWKVQRRGHCNVNADERLATVNALLEWIKTSEPAPNKEEGVTIEMNKPSVIEWINPLQPEEGGWGLIQRYNVYGDIFTNIQVSDLDLLGVKPNRRIEIKIEIDQYITKSFEGVCSLSGDSFDVRISDGEWILWTHASGCCVISKNNSLTSTANAASYAQFSSGSRIFLKAAPLPKPKKIDMQKFQGLL